MADEKKPDDKQAVANLLTRIFSPLRKGVEGQYRPGPYQVNYGGREGNGWLPVGSPVNYWQHGYSVRSHGEGNAMAPGEFPEGSTDPQKAEREEKEAKRKKELEAEQSADYKTRAATPSKK